MCGILLAINVNTKNQKGEIIKAPIVNEWILNQYEDQYARGQEGFGIIFIDEENKVQIKRATEPLKFLVDLNLNLSSKIIAHHRNPTSTDNKINQTHPISVKNKSLEFDYLVIHNGVICNSKEMKKLHEEAGFVYVTDTEEKTGYREGFNDSESAAIETARFIEKKISKMLIKGSKSIIALQINKETGKAENLFFFRDMNPLKMSKSRGKIRLSSEGEGADIEENVMYNCKLDEEMKLLKRTVLYDTIKETKWEDSRESPYHNTLGFYKGDKTKLIENLNDIREKNREAEIEEALNNRKDPTKEKEEEEKDKGIEGYIDKEKEEVLDILGDFCMDLEINPESADIENTIKEIAVVLTSLKVNMEQYHAMKDATEPNKIEYLEKPKDFIRDSIEENMTTIE